jgi:hypothetical protein
VNSTTNGELLKQALDALSELERRGNKQVSEARQQVEFLYEEYLGLKSLAAAIAALDPRQRRVSVFVFGSNLAGIHGAGAAAYAYAEHGAKWGQGIGLAGESYAIPTKDENIQTLPLSAIFKHVRDFVDFALAHSELRFNVTRIGCGLAGYTDTDIAPMFVGAPENCELPEGWRELIEKEVAE